MRLLIAVRLSAPTRERLAALQEDLRANALDGVYTKEEDLFLTLLPLGEVDRKKFDSVKRAVETVRFEPFEIVVDKIGSSRNGSSWRAEIRRDSQLTELRSLLIFRLIRGGILRVGEVCRPHIVLCDRVVSRNPDRKFKFRPFGETACTLDLIKADHTGDCPVYETVFRCGKQRLPIVVAPGDPAWPAEFEKLKEYLLTVADGLVTEIHHVGSTSVPGLAAKPILDVDIEIETMQEFGQLKERLAELGYRHEGNLGIEGREAFRYDTTRFMEHHLYVCPSDSPELERHLAFRDYLRASPDQVRAYGELKEELAARLGNNIDAYIDGKTEFILRCLSESKRIKEKNDEGDT